MKIKTEDIIGLVGISVALLGVMVVAETVLRRPVKEVPKRDTKVRRSKTDPPDDTDIQKLKSHFGCAGSGE